MTDERYRGSSGSRRPWRCALCCFLTLILLIGAISFPPLPVRAAEEPPQTTDVGAVLVVNLENNLTLFEKEADTNIYPSSSVKIMAGLLACRALAGRMNETVTVTAAMLSGVEGRRMSPPLADGETLAIRDLLYAAVCGGYNDATAVVACLSEGSVASFVEAMNKEALRLGTRHTRYTNPTGLHDPYMCTTVRDVAIIAREAYDNELFMQISSARTHVIGSTNIAGERSFTNRNYLISDSSQNYFNGYCKGMNAGMTDEGGWCVVTVYERGDVSNLCVAMRGKDVATGELIPTYVYVNRLLSWANRAYTYRSVLAKGEVLETVRVDMTGVSKSKAELVPVEDLMVYLPADVDISDGLEINTVLDNGSLTAPLTAGQVVGVVTATYQGRVVGKAELTVTENFTASGFLAGLMGFRAYLTSRPFFISALLFITALLVYLRSITGPGGRYGLRSIRRRRTRTWRGPY